MRIQAEVSLYPLRTRDLSEPIDTFCRCLRQYDLRVDSRMMSTVVSGDSDTVFEAVKRAFSSVAQEHQVVMTAKLSNACPERTEKE